MVLFTAEDATVDQKCAIAHELLDGFAKVPVFFLRAISSPLVRVAAVPERQKVDKALAAPLGRHWIYLGSVIEGPLSESSYLQVRTVL
jgi:hypothetical protein